MNNLTETQIRQITRADKPRLLDIMNDFYSSPALLHHTERAVLSKVIDDCLADTPYVECFVLTEGDRIAGYTIFAIGYSTEYGGISVMIEDLYICPEFRGKGYGKRLFKFAETRFKGRAVRLRLEVEPNNANAIALYKNCDFAEIGYKHMGKLL